MTAQFILNFHGIGTPHEGVDASERPYWISHRQFDDIVAMVCDRPDASRIRWTFDDGNMSDLEVGARSLASRQLTGSFFLLTGRFDDPRYISAENARDLHAMAMTVGLHGRDHIDWRRLDDSRLSAETDQARATLEEVLGYAVDRVAIPFGAYDSRVMRHLRQCGFARIYTSDGGASRSGARVQNRTSIRGDMSLAHIAALIDRRESWLRRARRGASTFARRNLV